MASASMKQIYTFLFVNMFAGDCYHHLMQVSSQGGVRAGRGPELPHGPG